MPRHRRLCRPDSCWSSSNGGCGSNAAPGCPPESCKVVLDALRAYVTSPRRDRIATTICCRIHVRRVPCQPLCRRCLETAFEIEQEINGAPDWFDDRGHHDGGGRQVIASSLPMRQARPGR